MRGGDALRGLSERREVGCRSPSGTADATKQVQPAPPIHNQTAQVQERELVKWRCRRANSKNKNLLNVSVALERQNVIKGINPSHSLRPLPRS